MHAIILVRERRGDGGDDVVVVVAAVSCTAIATRVAARRWRRQPPYRVPAGVKDFLRSHPLRHRRIITMTVCRRRDVQSLVFFLFRSVLFCPHGAAHGNISQVIMKCVGD